MRYATAWLWLLACATFAGEPSPGALKKAIDPVVDRKEFASAFWGIEVRGLTSGKVLYARDAGKNLTPASALKLVTTAAALDALGPEARIRTTLEAAGRQDGLGRILGDVYLVGRGDPLLSRRAPDGRDAFERLADELKAAGVRRIEGRLVGHDAAFRPERRGEGWSWGDLVWCYGAEVSALAWNDNCAGLRVSPGERVGDPVVVEREPWSGHYDVVSTATTSAPGAEGELALTRELGSNSIRLSGTLPLGAAPRELAVALEDPARYAATVFAERLERHGLRVTGGVATSSEPLPPGVRVLAGHDSPPLAEILKEANKPSQNLYAEMLLRLLGARAKGEGSAAAGQAAVGEFLSRIGAGGESWVLKDGSGLSRGDLVTPHDLAGLLVAMDRHPHAKAFKESLAVAGRDGTLEGRMKGTAAEGRVVAKTGTLQQVNALAGYVTTRSGGRLAFAIVVNHHPASAAAAIDEIMARLAGL